MWRYFQILVDTLIGIWLPAWRPRARLREVQHPELYLFDAGDALGLAGPLREPLEHAERAPLLETLVLHELRAAINSQSVGGGLLYWRTPSGAEVDFVWERGSKRIGIEVKAAKRWRREARRRARDDSRRRPTHRPAARRQRFPAWRKLIGPRRVRRR